MRIDFHPEATQELEESADWYKKRSRAAERGFVLAVEAAIGKISADPKRFPIVVSGLQACSVEAYPFQVIYRDDGARIFIIAIAHAKRHPEYWRERVQ